MVAAIQDKNGSKIGFTLEPWAWLQRFPEYNQARLQQELIDEINAEENILIEQRRKEKRAVMTATVLRRQSMLKEHQPEKYAKKMICLSCNIELRREFIAHFRALCNLARDIYKSWKRGDFSRKMPPDLFAPSMPPLLRSLPT